MVSVFRSLRSLRKEIAAAQEPPAAQALNAAFARAASDDTPTVRSARGQAEDFV